MQFLTSQFKGIILGITISICLLGISVLFAWTEPTLNPPQGNVSGPINISNTGQSKSGGLILNTGGAVTGLVVDKGNVGIGTNNPTKKLEVNGDILATGDVCTAEGICLSSLRYLKNLTAGGLTTGGGAHTGIDCFNDGGVVLNVGNSTTLCKFQVVPFKEYPGGTTEGHTNGPGYDAICPTGWRLYQNWTTTASNSWEVCDQYYCKTGHGHSWSNSPRRIGNDTDDFFISQTEHCWNMCCSGAGCQSYRNDAYSAVKEAGCY